jgi:hypothetical protein
VAQTTRIPILPLVRLVGLLQDELDARGNFADESHAPGGVRSFRTPSRSKKDNWLFSNAGVNSITGAGDAVMGEALLPAGALVGVPKASNAAARPNVARRL